MQEGFPMSLAIIVAVSIFCVMNAVTLIVIAVLLTSAFGG